MRSGVAVAIVVGILTSPMCAQHGASRGGFSGHAGSIGHSAPLRPSTPMRPSAPNGHSGPISRPAPMGFSMPVARGGPISPSRLSNPAPMRFGTHSQIPQSRLPYTGYTRTGGRGSGRNQGGRDRDRDGDRDHHRRPYWRGYEVSLGYGYLGWPGYPYMLNYPGYFGYGNSDYDSYETPNADYGRPVPPGDAYSDSMQPYSEYAGQPDPNNYGNGANYSSPAVGYQPTSRQPYTGSVEASNLATPQQAVTLVFNDGRPSEQIRNYLITSSTLTVLDQKYREIPLDQINLAATQQTNGADGIDFRVPVAPN